MRQHTLVVHIHKPESMHRRSWTKENPTFVRYTTNAITMISNRHKVLFHHVLLLRDVSNNSPIQNINNAKPKYFMNQRRKMNIFYNIVINRLTVAAQLFRVPRCCRFIKITELNSTKRWFARNVRPNWKTCWHWHRMSNGSCDRSIQIYSAAMDRSAYGMRGIKRRWHGFFHHKLWLALYHIQWYEI